MTWRRFKKQMDFYKDIVKCDGNRLYAFPLGPLEIALIVIAVILVFGVGKLANVGGALGKSIREFRKEKDRSDEEPKKLTAKESKEEEITHTESKPTEEHKD